MPKYPEKLRDLQYRLLYATVVAGKTYRFAEKVMERLMERAEANGYDMPFEFVRACYESRILPQVLRKIRTGAYTRLEKCWPELIKLDPTTCTVQELEAVYGVGPKTARFFVLWTRADEKVAALDTHILRWLREQGYDAPRSTPPAGPKYAVLEEAFLAEAEKRQMTPKQLDAEIWEEYSGYRVGKD